MKIMERELLFWRNKSAFHTYKKPYCNTKQQKKYYFFIFIAENQSVTGFPSDTTASGWVHENFSPSWNWKLITMRYFPNPYQDYQPGSPFQIDSHLWLAKAQEVAKLIFNYKQHAESNFFREINVIITKFLTLITIFPWNWFNENVLQN